MCMNEYTQIYRGTCIYLYIYIYIYTYRAPGRVTQAMVSEHISHLIFVMYIYIYIYVYRYFYDLVYTYSMYIVTLYPNIHTYRAPGRVTQAMVSEHISHLIFGHHDLGIYMYIFMYIYTCIYLTLSTYIHIYVPTDIHI
jgi:hypothetical protein